MEKIDGLWFELSKVCTRLKKKSYMWLCEFKCQGLIQRIRSDKIRVAGTIAGCELGLQINLQLAFLRLTWNSWIQEDPINLRDFVQQ